MTEEMEMTPSATRPWARLLVIGIVVAVLGVGFVQINNSLRANRISSATLETLEKEAKQSPNDIDLLYRLAYRQLSDGKSKEATQVMQRVVEMEPNKTRAWFGLARCASGAGNALEAVNAYKKVLELEPNGNKTHLLLGEIYAGAGLTTDAVREYDAGNDPKEAARFGGDVWAEALIKKGRAAEAWDLLVTSLNGSPMQEDAYIRMAEMAIQFQQKEKFAEAEMWLQRRIGLTPYPEVKIRLALARVLLAQPGSRGSLHTAEIILRVQLERAENHEPDSSALLGRVLMAANQWKEAQKELEIGLKAQSDHRDCLAALAEVCAKLGQAERAASLRARVAAIDSKDAGLRQLRNAVEAAPDDSNARFALMEALDKATEFGEAAEQCEAILAKNPNDARASSLRDSYRQKALEKLTKSGELHQSSSDRQITGRQ